MRGKFVIILSIAVAEVFVILIGSEKQKFKPNDIIVFTKSRVSFLLERKSMLKSPAKIKK